MDATITPGSLHGSLPAISSKSMAHRLLILATLANQQTEFVCNTTSEDIQATARCLEALQQALSGGVASEAPVVLDCGESGSTLRFLLPVVCALGVPVRLICHGRLASRPLAPLDSQLALHGIALIKTDDSEPGYIATGRLAPGRFVLPGNVSSQYVSGLLMAASVMDNPTEVLVSKPVESRPYVELTMQALNTFGQSVSCDEVVVEGVPYERFGLTPTGLVAPSRCVVEGDWSNSAFWLAAGTFEQDGLTVTGLDMRSTQGDRAILAALSSFGARIARRGNAARATKDLMRATSLDVSAFPDLVPPLAAVAATVPGTSRLSNAGRLRLKESDRLASVSRAINRLGGHARIEGDDLVIEGTDKLSGGSVYAYNDHRIAMMAAIMATHASGCVTIQDAGCVAKSYPTFWEDYARLGGIVELSKKDRG